MNQQTTGNLNKLHGILFDILFAKLWCSPILVLLHVCFGQLAVYPP